MKVLALAADEGGSGFYRLRAPAAEAAKLGVDVTVASGFDAEAIRYPNGMTEVTEIKEDVDLMIFQRPLDNAMTSAIQQAHRQGIATIVELDDDFSMVHAQNVAQKAMQGETSGAKWVEKASSLADHVTVSTPQLLKYARHGRGTVLRNCVPVSIFETPAQPRPDTYQWPSIGWTGTVQTHPTDLQQTKGAVGEILKANGLPFNVIGDGAQVSRNLRLSDSTPVYATGWVPISQYYQNIKGFLDIGIVPLEMSPFNEAKSALKGLEYAALGIPFVATPTREYVRLEAHGIGKTAKTPGEWRKHLQRMIDRPSETERIGREARDRIEAEHIYSVTAPQWIEAWEKAIHYRKTRP